MRDFKYRNIRSSLSANVIRLSFDLSTICHSRCFSPTKLRRLLRQTCMLKIILYIDRHQHTLTNASVVIIWLRIDIGRSEAITIHERNCSIRNPAYLLFTYRRASNKQIYTYDEQTSPTSVVNNASNSKGKGAIQYRHAKQWLTPELEQRKSLNEREIWTQTDKDSTPHWWTRHCVKAWAQYGMCIESCKYNNNHNNNDKQKERANGWTTDNQ